MEGHDENPAADAVESGTAGASARREFERRRSRREGRVRTRFPRVGGLLLAITEDPQSTTAWKVGARGEEIVGRGLDERVSDTLRVLHDRRIPKSRANIDHIAITPSGVIVIDAKRYAGRPTLHVEGGLFRERTERLLIGRRDGTKLVDGVLHQIDIVWAVVGNDVPVRGALCFVDADWPTFGGDFTTRGVRVLWLKKLQAELAKPGPLTPDAIADIHRRLAAQLPPA